MREPMGGIVLNRKRVQCQNAHKAGPVSQGLEYGVVVYKSAERLTADTHSLVHSPSRRRAQQTAEMNAKLAVCHL